MQLCHYPMLREVIGSDRTQISENRRSTKQGQGQQGISRLRHQSFVPILTLRQTMRRNLEILATAETNGDFGHLNEASPLPQRFDCALKRYVFTLKKVFGKRRRVHARRRFLGLPASSHAK